MAIAPVNLTSTGAQIDAAVAAYLAGGAPLGFAGWTPVTASYFTRTGSAPATESYASGKFEIASSGALAGSTFYAETVSGDFDRVYAMTARLPQDTNAAIGVFIGDAGNTNKSLAMVSLSNDDFLVQNFLGTGFSSNGTNTGLDDLAVPTALVNNLHYWRIVRVGTAVDAYFSIDGIQFTHVADWTSTEDGIVTLDQIGIYYETNGLTAGRPMGLTIHGVDDGPQAEATSGGGAGGTTSLVPTQTEITASTYDTLDADFDTSKEIKRVNNASGCTVTVTAGHTNKGVLTFIQTGAGAITMLADTGVTIVSAGSLLSSSGTGAFLSLVPDADTANTYYLTGGLA